MRVSNMMQGIAFFQRVVTTLLWLAAGYVFLRWLLVPLLPFLLALGLSALLEPAVIRLGKRLGGRRKWAAGLLTTAVLVVAGGGLGTLILRLAGELQSWAERLPAVVEAFPAMWNGLLDRMEQWYVDCPLFLRAALDQLAEQLMAKGPDIAGAVGGWAMGFVSSFFAALPDFGLFLMTTILALYFVSLSYPNILAFLKRQLPERWQCRCREAVWCCRSTLLRWLRAELSMISLTFLLLFVGFTLMRLPYTLLAAVFIALVDALPVLGTGTVLIPWAILSLLGGNSGQALALAALYAATSLMHTLLEPRLLARQADLPAVAALLAMYLGFHFMGVGGMLLMPLLLLLVKQLQDGGVIRIWR